MACNCSNECSCLIEGGEGVTVTGSGTAADRYVIGLDTSGVVLSVVDTATLDLSAIGSGTTLDPFVLSGVVTLRLQELTDIDDPAGPGVGDVPVWNGSAWEFAPPPTVPPGAVNTIPGGLVGDGSFGDPLGVNVSEDVVDATTGLYTYIDSAGELRAEVRDPTAPTWASITGKPTTFAPIIGSSGTSAKAGNWFPTLDEVGNGITISATEPVGKPDGHIWLDTSGA